MKRNIAVIIVLFVCSVCRLNAEVLYWMINDPSIVTPYASYTIDTYRSPTVKDDEGDFARINTARVAAYGEGDPIYLNMYYDFGTGYELYDGMDIAEVMMPEKKAGPIWVDMGKLSGEPIAYMFALELGYTDERGNWSVLAISNEETYTALRKFMNHGPASFPIDRAWAPNVFNVPEPNSTFLILIGVSLLFLKRKTRLIK